MERKREVFQTYFTCDTCDQEMGDDKCAMCGKHVCGCCAGDGTEDGQLCSPCSKRYEIHEPSGGGVGIRDKKTRKLVWAPHL